MRAVNGRPAAPYLVKGERATWPDLARMAFSSYEFAQPLVGSGWASTW